MLLDVVHRVLMLWRKELPQNAMSHAGWRIPQTCPISDPPTGKALEETLYAIAYRQGLKRRQVILSLGTRVFRRNR